jgi:hypothetical protein
MILTDRLPATTDAIAYGLVRVAQFALMTDRGSEDFLVEIRAHSLDDLMIEKAIGLRLAAEDAPLAPSAPFSLGLARFVAIVQASELTRGDDFGYPETVPLRLVRGHAIVLLVLLAIFGEHVEAANAIGWFDSHAAKKRLPHADIHLQVTASPPDGRSSSRRVRRPVTFLNRGVSTTRQREEMR